MSTELADDATHEQITEYVDQIVQDVQEDRAGDTTDAQKIAADNDDQILAETQSGKVDAAPEGDDSGETAPPARDWLDDNLKAEIAAYGIDEQELADFTSREEVERALRFFDRSALEAGRKAMASEQAPPEEQGPVRDDQGRFTKEAPKQEVPTDGRYEVSQDFRDRYEEELVGEFEKLRDHYESRLSGMESRFNELQAQAEEQVFDSYVDTIGHADLFGVTGKETEKHLQRRMDLHVAVKAHQIGLRALGRPADLDQSLVSRVARMVFADELGKKDLKDRTRKMSQQSNRRQGGGVTKAHEDQEPLMAEMERLYKELENA